ncbi:MAG: hypothetical protein E7205_10860 [Tissierellaceae bacterium]|nr:hypothetical protein [Tissierellaceae bacterium]
MDKEYLERLLLSQSKNYLLLDEKSKLKFMNVFNNNFNILSEETILMILLNLRIPFFEEFDLSKKDDLVDILLRRKFKDITVMSNIIEFMGVIFKHCSYNAQLKMCAYLYEELININNNPNTIISLCNFVWMTFKSLNLGYQEKMYAEISSLLEQNKYPFLYDTIDYTYQQILMSDY